MYATAGADRLAAFAETESSEALPYYTETSYLLSAQRMVDQAIFANARARLVCAGTLAVL